jgi:dipeptidase D
VEISGPESGAGQSGRSVSTEDTARAINLMLALPHGVIGMSLDIEGLVETSTNFATVEIKDDALKILSSQRSSVMSKLDELSRRIEALSALAGADTESGNAYPAWEPNMDSPLLERCKNTYQKLYGKQPSVEIIHAGVECAILGTKYPGMDMISLGPTIENPHSPEERINIPTIGKVWDYLVEILKSFGP